MSAGEECAEQMGGIRTSVRSEDFFEFSAVSEVERVEAAHFQVRRRQFEFVIPRRPLGRPGIGMPKKGLSSLKGLGPISYRLPRTSSWTELSRPALRDENVAGKFCPHSNQRFGHVRGTHVAWGGGCNPTSWDIRFGFAAGQGNFGTSR